MGAYEQVAMLLTNVILVLAGSILNEEFKGSKNTKYKKKRKLAIISSLMVGGTSYFLLSNLFLQKSFNIFCGINLLFGFAGIELAKYLSSLKGWLNLLDYLIELKRKLLKFRKEK